MIEERLISEPEFRRMLGGISHPTFWKMEQRHGFPQHVNIGRRKVWALSEAVSYIENLVRAARCVKLGHDQGGLGATPSARPD